MTTVKDETAYFIVTPNPLDDLTTNHLWIKFGDTANPGNTRASQYNTYNPSFHVKGEKKGAGLGKRLETRFLKESKIFIPIGVDIEKKDEDGWRASEWYGIEDKDEIESIKKFIKNVNNFKYEGVKEVNLPVRKNSKWTVKGKSITFPDQDEAKKFFGDELEE